MVKRLAVVPSDTIQEYLDAGYNPKWLEDYYNPNKFFDEVYLLSPHERDQGNLMGMNVYRTTAKEFKKRLKELKIDLVRAYGAFWPADLACKNKVDGIPVIVSVHDTNPNLLHDSIRNADFVFSMSKAVQDLVLTRFSKSQNSWILPNRVNFEVMRPYKKESLNDLDQKFPFKYKILYVGRIHHEKNPDTVIKALKLLGKDYCFILAGFGDPKIYQDLARMEGVANQCFFIGAVKNEQLARYFSFADCMCTPSRLEGFGMVFIEAMACEAIVVTSDVAPMNEYIKHQVNGLLVKEFEDPRAMADMIVRVCTDQNVRSLIKNNVRSSVEKFEKSNVEAIEISYYKKAYNLYRERVGIWNLFRQKKEVWI